MSSWDLIAVVLVVSTLFGFLNHRYLRLPTSIGVTLVALVFSLALLGVRAFGVDLVGEARALLDGIDFSKTLLNEMLGFMLFAGALQINAAEMNEQKGVIAALATSSVVMSTALVSAISYGVFQLVDLNLSWIACLLFGALISPTDPVAVLAILKEKGVRGPLPTRIAGESLFNDGMAVVVFLTILRLHSGGAELHATPLLLLFLRETAGGIVFGLVAGYMAYWLLKRTDNYSLEILTSLAVVAGGYALAEHLGVSAPIAMVVSGLLIGNRGRRLAMSEITRRNLDLFWEVIDDILKLVLFVLIGLEVLAVEFGWEYLWSLVLLIPAVLLSRLISVTIPVALSFRAHPVTGGAVALMTWGGLRGGLSIAMALSLPNGHERDAIVTMTYGIVAFAILVQGLTIGRLVPENDRIDRQN